MFKSISYLLIIPLLPIVLLAQPYHTDPNDSLTTYNLSGVVITANKLATPEIEVASSVTVLTEKEIQNSGKNSLVDLLRETPGVSVVRQGGPGALATVFVRGANPGHTLVFLDGVAMNDPGSLNNAFDFTNLQTDNIERIEILRGPQSTLYGSSAMAGVISIFTKHGGGYPKLSVSTFAGSFDTYKANAILSGGNKKLDYSLSLSNFNTKGFSMANEKYGNSEPDGVKNNSVLSHIGLNITPGLDLTVSYNYFKAKAGLDQNEMTGDDPNFTSNTEESVFMATLNNDNYQGLWKQKLGFSSLRHINHTTDDPDALHVYSSRADFDGTKYKLDWQNNILLNPKNTLSFGAEKTVEKATTYYLSDGLYGTYVSYFPDHTANTTGLYIQDQVSGIYNFFYGTAGLRYDNHNKFGPAVTARFAPAVLIKWEYVTKIKASYGNAFKSPALYYLFDPVYGNPDLKPEKSKGWDFGIEQYMFNPNIVLGVSWFSNMFTDLIGFDKNYKTINIDKAGTRGIEVTLLTPVPVYNFSVKANYTYTESRDNSDDQPESGMELIRRPGNKLALNINYTPDENADLNLEVINVGRRIDKDFSAYPASRVELLPYTLINLAASYNVAVWLNVFAKIDNLLNEDYEEVLYYGTPKRSAYFGIKLTY
ncbi:MAG: TonB-dependent receptor [Ignavibacteria bacterium]